MQRNTLPHRLAVRCRLAVRWRAALLFDCLTLQRRARTKWCQVVLRHFVAPDSCERASKTRDYTGFHNWERKIENSRCSSHIICSTHIDKHRENYIGLFRGYVWELPFDWPVSIFRRDSQHRYFIFLSSASVFFNYILLTELQTKLGSCYSIGAEKRIGAESEGTS